MVGNDGKPQDESLWYNFIQVTLNHDGVLEDTARATKALAAHYDTFPQVVGYQIFNEPHFPAEAVYDYHPDAIEAFRRWLCEKGYLCYAAARAYEPPRHRYDKTPHDWALWRLFARDSLTEFLASASRASQEQSKLPTYTCYTGDQIGPGNATRNIDVFSTAANMDITGYTCYLNAEGMNYFSFCCEADINRAAAAAYGRKSWCIELDSRTAIPPRIFNKNTYATVGSGITGIVYYQWRGDHPSPATPIPNGCGLVNYDGSRTPNYENAAAMFRLLNRLSEKLAGAEPRNNHVAIFYSDYAYNYCDAAENRNDVFDGPLVCNSYLNQVALAHTELHRLGFTVDFVNADTLKNNPLGVTVLLVPTRDYLSTADARAVDGFVAAGGTAWDIYERQSDTASCGYGYIPHGQQCGLYQPSASIYDVAELCDTKPAVTADSPFLMPQALFGKDYAVLAVTNISAPHRPREAALTCDFPVGRAVLYSTPDTERELKVEGNRIFTGPVEDGAFILVTP